MPGQSPTVEHAADDTSRRLVLLLPERSVRRLGRSAIGTSMSGPKYRGVLPYYVSRTMPLVTSKH